MRERWWMAIALFGLLVAAVGAVWFWSPFPWGPVLPGEEACVAAARDPGERVIYELRASHDPMAQGEDIEALGQLTPTLTLEDGELVEARPVWTWSSDNWCVVEGVETETRDTRVALSMPLYAKATSLEAVPASLAVDARRGSRQRQADARVHLQSCWATEQLELQDMTLSPTQGSVSVLWRRWGRAPGTIGCSIYRIRDGRPEWLFARVLWGTMWCDPCIEITPGTPAHPDPQIVAFQPPLWPLVYTWDGDHFSESIPTWRQLLMLPRLALWSYRRWLILAGVVAILVSIARVIRRRRSRRE